MKFTSSYHVKKLEETRKPHIHKIIDKYKNLNNCTHKNLFIWLLSNEDTEILNIVSSCIIELINYRAKMLNED